MEQNQSNDERRAYLNRLAIRAVTDEAAFVELYNEFFPVVYRFLLSKSKNGEVADEAVSRTFLNMYAHLGEYDESRGAFSTWLFRIAVNELRMIFRAKQRSLDMAWDERFDPPAPEHASPEERVLAGERREELRQALLKLSERDRRIITMTYWLDMKSEEIAEELDMKPNSVRVALKRARAELREYLEAG